MANGGKENLKQNYYLGLDIGTDSVGYAVCNSDYQLLKHKGEAMWGTHVFDAALPADERRAFRTARRRLDRCQQRVALIQELFAPEIAKVDKDFYRRIMEKELSNPLKTYGKGLYTDPYFNDKTYFKQYPTIHHLLMDLINNKEPKDVRLVYSACVWLVAHRGHFLSDVAKENIDALIDFKAAYQEFMACFEEIKPWAEDKPEEMLQILLNVRGVTKKETELKKLLFGGKKPNEEDGFAYSRSALIKLLAGGQTKLNILFIEQEFVENASLSVNMGEEEWLNLLGELPADADMLAALKKLVDCAELKRLLDGEKYISIRKIKIYEQHKADLRQLKYYVKKYCPDKYREIFVLPGVNNYVAYSKNTRSLKEGEVQKEWGNQEDFCKYLEKQLENVAVAAEDEKAWAQLTERIKEGSFMPKQVTDENRLIPYQLYWIELKAILDNARNYLPFLQEKDADGFSVYDKILSVFSFRIPYYVGPLNSSSQFAWLERKAEGKILPWNFDKMVDRDLSEQNFIKRMTNKCSYLPMEDVLPKCSMLYQKFEVLNELNNLKVNGEAVTPEVKQALFVELFQKAKSKVSKKKLKEQLMAMGLADKEAVISGVDDVLKGRLTSYHAFKRLMADGKLDWPQVERIILQSTVCEDRLRFKRWLKDNFELLDGADIKYIATIKCKDFGRLSARFLTALYQSDDDNTGIIEMMWQTNNNLMQLLSDNFKYLDEVKRLQKEYYSANPLSLDERMAELYLSPAVRRPIVRALDIISDVVKANGGNVPQKFFIEMARGADENTPKGKYTKSRYQQITELYRSIGNDCKELQQQLESMGEEVNNRLQSDKLFLYYMQLGKSIYSGKPLSLADLTDDSKVNIDHIYPRSKVADDSVLNNKVLCLSEENAAKGDKYPVPALWRQSMQGWWAYLKKNNLITDEKFKRLTRSGGFTEEEKWGFINRQLVETRQATKAIATLLQEKYPQSEVVYVKAGIVSDFRHEYGFVKSRAVNDLHHAKDAYLNVVVGDVYNRKYTKRFFIKHSEDYSIKLSATFGSQKGGTWQGTNYFSDDNIATVQNTMRKNNIHYTAYAYCKHGGLFDQQPRKAEAGLVPLKKGLPTEIYGGYRKPAAAYYVLAKYFDGKKPEVMLVPIELMDRKEFEDPNTAIDYVSRQIGKIINKKPENVSLPLGKRMLKIKTVFELDGFRVCLNGKSSGGKEVLLSPLNALVLSADDERYIKRLESFCRKLAKNPNLTYNEKYDTVNNLDNIALYGKLLQKIDKFYIKRPALPMDKITNSLEKFKKLDIKHQAQALLSLVSLFGRSFLDNSFVDYGSKNCRLSSKLSNWASKYNEVYIIDQSASGIYQTKSINLLELLK